eukprot:TRINITY_DN4227_c0_g1_i1.p1 TRINITY_DN4227_c0_g1~~TRINITY_DN4227_c0_g1_i1.p1  ORF type:complete len:217 (-),score=59.76 TRINITY_DN4227_c0_g1_i1:222-872(-)
MIRRPPRSTLSSSSAASDVYKRQVSTQSTGNGPRTMGCGGSNEQDAKRAEAARINASELLTLKMIQPMEWSVQAHALDTVRTLLGMCATQLGLEERHGGLLELVFSEEQIKDHSSTLQSAGLMNEAEFEVVHESGDVNTILEESAAAKLVDIYKAVENEKVSEVALVCKYDPERVVNARTEGRALDRELTPLHFAGMYNDNTQITVQDRRRKGWIR